MRLIDSDAFDLIRKRIKEVKSYGYCSECGHRTICDKVEKECGGEDLCGATMRDIALSIVSEVEAEYGNGWIPCSERYPNREEYQKSNGQFIVSDGNRSYATYFDIYDTFKFGEPTMEGFRVDRCVIAWMPLPSPYKPTTD